MTTQQLNKGKIRFSPPKADLPLVEKFEVRFFKKGFTLVELIVSMSIAAIMMVGISAFFSSTFSNMLLAQNQAAALERQSVVNEIIKDKFSALDYLVEDGDDYILSFNKNTKDQLPFSYIGMDSGDHLVFKDLLVFNKISIDPGSNDQIFANSGDGTVKKTDGGTPSPNMTKTAGSDFFDNFSSFEKIGNKYYVVFPHKNKVMECDCSATPCSSNCSDLPNMKSQLLSPTDIAADADGNNLFISDSGNGRVIKYKIGVGEDPQPLATGLKYPTGLAYYDDGDTKWLFISDTLDHKIRKIDTNIPLKLPIVVGGGDDEACSNTARFCKLSLPTGLYADSAKHELYIADSGNDRILKMSDPGAPKSLTFNFSPGGNYALDRITFENSNWSGGDYYDSNSNLIGDNTNYSKTTKTFSNPDRLTVFTNTACKSSGTTVFTNEEFLSTNFNLSSGDKVAINKTAYTISSITNTTDCKDALEAPSLPKGKIVLTTGVNPSPNLGDTIYLANPDTVTVQIDNATVTNPGNASFQTFIIKTYDIFNGLVSTDYHVERVGDGKLGTEEDTIEVVASGSNIKFPTGVTNAYFANSGKNEVLKMDKTSSQALNAIDVRNFDTYDYVSQFTLAEKDPVSGDDVTPIKFVKYNSDSILELIINANVDEDTIQTYKLNAAIP